MPPSAILLLATLLSAPADTVPSRACVGTSAVGSFRLLVKSPSGANPLALRLVNNIAANSKISYEPIQLPDSLKRNGKLAIIAVPADADQRAAAGATVLEPKLAGSPSDWIAPFRIGTLLVVFGPQGLDEKRLTNLISRDDALIDDLARYAERTVELESTVEALAALDEEEEEILDPSRIARGSASDQALFTLARALNPSATYFNPLKGGHTVGPQTKSGLAAQGFFENAGGLFPGGGALSMVKTWLMPDSEFRTVYAENSGPDGLTLCAQKSLTRSRNRMVYLWGYQLVNSNAPAFLQGADLTIPSGTKSLISLKTESGQDWPMVERVREWTLVNAAAKREYVVPRMRSAARNWAEIDLRKMNVEPGVYELRGRWDWDSLTARGAWRVAAPGDLKQAKLTADSTARLVENSGMAPLEIEGTDFQFVERVTLKRAGTLGAIHNELEFRLPQGFRAGPQNRLQFEVNTDTFHAGAYLVALQQSNGKVADVPMRIAPAPARISNLPLRLNLGESQQRMTLRGTGLDRLPSSIETQDGLKIQMLDGSDTERDAVVQLAANTTRARGSRLAAPGGLVFQIAGAKPRIVSASASMPDETPVALREGELLSGSLVSFQIRAENVQAPAALIASCADTARTLAPLKLQLGERRAGGVKFDAVGEGAFYAAFDPGLVAPPGCALEISIEGEAAGRSAPFAVGRVVRLPHIASLQWTDEKSAGGYVAILRGTDLEVIEKAGWEGASPVAVANTPRSAGDSQTLRVVLPWPPPSPLAPVWIWLRGDQQGRRCAIAK